MATAYQETEVRFKKNPGRSFAVGTLAVKDRELFFEYDTQWLARNLELSPFMLPLKPGLVKHQDLRFGPLFGVFDDSLPDGWGLLLMDRAFRSRNIDPATLSVLDRLQYLGEETMGALIYHPPAASAAANRRVLDLELMAAEAREVYAGKSSDILPELMRAGGSPGGARPKVLVGFNPDTEEMISGEDDLPSGFEHWLVKFSAGTEEHEAGKVEYAYSLMARAAGIKMMETRLFEAGKNNSCFGIKRFDRGRDNRRYHIHSFAGLIQSNFRIPSCDYKDLFRATSLLTRNYNDLEQLYRVMLFNVLSHNRDDHAKNFSFILDDTNNNWSLAPAYDLTFSQGPGGEHSSTINGEGKFPTAEQCVRLAGESGISGKRANEIADEVAETVSCWLDFAGSASVPAEAVPKLQR